MGLIVGICGGLIIYLIYFLCNLFIDSIDKWRIQRMRNTPPSKPIAFTSSIKAEVATNTTSVVQKAIEPSIPPAPLPIAHKSLVETPKPALSELLLSHKAATDEYFGREREWFDYNRFAEVSESCRALVQEHNKQAATKSSVLLEEIKQANFDGPCNIYRLPEKELNGLLDIARNKTQTENAYDALKLLLPYHFFRNFKKDRQPMCINRYGETYIHPDLPMGFSGETEKEQAYSRSYLARLIVVCNFDWREVIQATEYMMRVKMITMPARDVKNELEAVRWCAKYWYRAYMFNEPINFDYSTNEFRRISKPGKRVSDYKVPSTLQLPALHIQDNYSIVLAHEPKKRNSY